MKYSVTAYNIVAKNEVSGVLSVVYVKGVKLDRDSHGNIYLTKLTDCSVIVKGFRHPENHCIADEVVKTSGHVVSEKTKVIHLLQWSG